MPRMIKDQILVKIFRFDPKTETRPKFKTYRLPYNKRATVLGILRYIYENVDRTLAFRDYHCGAHVCGGCRVKLNGKIVRACNTRVYPGDIVTLVPVDEGAVIRDLVVVLD